MSRHSFVHRPQISGAGRNFLFETLPQYALEERFGERWRQFSTRLPVTTFAAVESDGCGGAARSCRVAVHQISEFIVGQPDLWHAGHPCGLAAMFTCNSNFLFKIGHSNDKKNF